MVTLTELRDPEVSVSEQGVLGLTSTATGAVAASGNFYPLTVPAGKKWRLKVIQINAAADDQALYTLIKIGATVFNYAVYAGTTSHADYMQTDITLSAGNQIGAYINKVGGAGMTISALYNEIDV